jgi:hypothetical protein
MPSSGCSYRCRRIGKHKTFALKLLMGIPYAPVSLGTPEIVITEMLYYPLVYSCA